MPTDAGPVRVPAPRRYPRADLHRAIWEASQYMTTDDIAEFVRIVLNDIDSDEP